MRGVSMRFVGVGWDKRACERVPPSVPQLDWWDSKTRPTPLTPALLAGKARLVRGTAAVLYSPLTRGKGLPMIISRTPFRVSFLGGGTDYPAWFREHGGAVLAATI